MNLESSPQPISTDVLREKYMEAGEQTVDDVYRRVARGLAAVEKTPQLRAEWEQKFYDNMHAGAIGAGRIMSAAGTDMQATLINCFVQPVGDAIRGVDEEGLPGIFEALNDAAETMRRGGGVGYNFSKLRPKGALVKATNSQSSGPCSYMDVFDKACSTVESAGFRRGAQMGILRCDHPDIEEFIVAKRTKGRWNNFNVSAGVTDAFMQAVASDSEWHLHHTARPFDTTGRFQSAVGWIYRTVRARDLWDKIMQSAYDFAEPGIFFLDNVNRDNNLNYTEHIDCCNPCVPGDTPILTRDGYVPIINTVGNDVEVWNGREFSAVRPFSTGVNPTLSIDFSNGVTLRCTPAHKFVLAGERWDLDGGPRVEARNLLVGDKLAKFSMPVIESGASYGDGKEAYSQGFYSGDGSADCGKSFIYEPKYSCIPRLVGNVGEVTAQGGRRCWYHGEMRTKDWVPVDGDMQYCLNWLAGLLDSDGTLCTDAQGGQSFQITSVDKRFLLDVRLTLTRLGVQATVSKSHGACRKEMPDGKGGSAVYECQDAWRLVINNFDSWALVNEIGLQTSRISYTGPTPNRSAARFVTVVSVTPADECETFCFTEPKNHTGTFNGLVTGQCGEQPLPAYGCCDLGPVILTKFVREPFTVRAWFDFDSFSQAVKIQVRALDNVLDATFWPLEQQRKESESKRRIGVGFTGLGNALAMLKLRYDSDEGRTMATEIAEEMRDSAYRASVELAAEKGAFPLFDADGYLAKGTFASRLPKGLKDQIREHGIRNSHLLSIAPTGTVSLAFADNASNGIEPPFSWGYTRKKREGDGTTTEYEVEDHSYRLYRSMFGDNVDIPEYFVTALEMSAADHLAMMAAVQPYIDTAISKTVNVPADYPFEDFKGMYMEAWKSGLKGLATYRPNDILGSVLSVTPTTAPTPAAPAAAPEVDPMRAVIETRPLGGLPAVTEKVVYWTSEGKQQLYLIVSFLPLADGRERAIEFFMPVGQSGESQQWVSTSMRLLSLAARGGFLERALEDMRKVRWDRGPVRLGTYEKPDGGVVPMWHDSEAAAISYAVQQIIARREDQLNLEQLVRWSIETPEVPVTASPAATMSGKKCPECGAHAMIKKDGCSFCTSCGHVGACG